MLSTLQYLQDIKDIKSLDNIVNNCIPIEIDLKEGKLIYLKLKEGEPKDVSNKSS